MKILYQAYCGVEVESSIDDEDTLAAVDKDTFIIESTEENIVEEENNEEDIGDIELPPEKERIIERLRNQLSEYEGTYLFTTLGQYTISLGEE